MHLQDLIQQAQNGQVQAFDRLFDLLSDRFYRFFFLRLRDAEEARDLLHDLFLELWHSLPRYQARGGIPFTAWVYRIARRMLFDLWRKRAGRKLLSLDAYATLRDRAKLRMGYPMERVEEERLEEEMMVGRVLELLPRLSQKEREVVTLRYLEEISTVEVGKILNLKPANVRQISHRALKRLRKWLENGGAEPKS